MEQVLAMAHDHPQEAPRVWPLAFRRISPDDEGVGPRLFKRELRVHGLLEGVRSLYD